jgi:hypothetical protein
MFDELGRSAEVILASLLSDMNLWWDGKEADPMKPPTPPDPELVDVKR